MREILYRGKCVDNGKWIDNGEWVLGVAFPHDNDRCTMFFQNPLCGELDGCEVDPNTVCQYIGRKDSKGARIYEGDIVRRTDGTQLEVIWADSGSGFFLRQVKPYTPDLVRSFLWNCEVIGNIYDNPELIEDKGND